MQRRRLRAVRYLKATIVSAALLLTAVACGSPPLPTAKVYVFRVAWLDDTSVYFLREADDQGRELWRVTENGASERALAEIPNGCFSYPGSVTFLTNATPGHLAVGVECRDGRTNVYSVNPLTKATSRIADIEAVRDVAFSGAANSGYASQGVYPCMRIALFQADRMQDWSLEVPYAGGSWNMYDAYAGTRECDSAGIAKSPITSPAGGFVGFLVTSSPLQLGRSATAVDGYVWKVALTEPEGSVVRYIGPNIQGAVALAASPDGRRIAVAISGRDGGILMIDVASGASTKIISSTSVNDVAFSPDGRRLAYVVNLERVVVSPAE
jgi:hypothetical protein